MSKAVMEQRDRHNQRLTLHLELENGEQAQPMIYMRRLLKTQDLSKWNGQPEAMRDWLAEQMANYFKRIQVHIC